MQKSQSKPSGTIVMRGLRFPIQIPIFYRELGHPVWRRGVTLNISRSGVLFLGEEPLKRNAVIKMKMQLPGVVHGEAPGILVCSGKVIRSISAVDTNAAPVLGATFSTYRLTHGQKSALHNGPHRG